VVEILRTIFTTFPCLGRGVFRLAEFGYADEFEKREPFVFREAKAVIAELTNHQRDFSSIRVEQCDERSVMG
jgi:hypothetical protein